LGLADQVESLVEQVSEEYPDNADRKVEMARDLWRRS
jgi:hypothetical protein